MAFTNIVSRTDAQALMPEEVSDAMLKRATDDSAVLQRFRHVPVGRAQVRFPVLSALPVAYFRSGDTGLVQTTEVNWTNKYLNIEEIDTIMPVPNNVIDDADIPIWDESMPYLAEAAARCLDQAVFFGVNAPGTFPTNILSATASAGNAITEGTAASAGGYMADVDKAYGAIEADGFEADGWVAGIGLKGKLRAARDTLGQKLDVGRVGNDLRSIDGLPVTYPMRGLWPSTGSTGTNVRGLVGDWTQFVVGVRSDISFEVLSEAVIQDNTGAIIYNLAQQRMKGLLLTFRVGWQVANILNYDQPTEGSRYPVASLVF